MSENKVNNLLGVSMDKIKEMVDVNTVIGDPITAPDGTGYKESALYGGGADLAFFEAGGIRFGCTICYDIRFPELYLTLRRMGAEAILVPSNFTLQTGKDHWEVLCRARAIETETYFCAAAQTGAHTAGNDTRHTYGHSLVADPWGHVVAKASDGVGVVSARVDPKRVEKARQMIPVAQHRVRLAE